MTHSDILNFWFDEITPSQWWKKDKVFDQQIVSRFSAVHRQASCCELFHWRQTVEGRLAEIIVLDQFSRNIYRNTASAFAFDSLALALAQEAVSLDADKQLKSEKRCFLYIPFMHSESPAIHEIAMQLYTENGSQSELDYEIRHRAIIQRFGRYPHRNELLGRVSTEQEVNFLSQPGSRF